jgi:hypothetical protein
MQDKDGVEEGTTEIIMNRIRKRKPEESKDSESRVGMGSKRNNSGRTKSKK